MQHQTHTTTHINRYPKIFQFLSNNFSNTKKILSFGCSSGEECFSLREYFKEAEIFGTDINNDMLNLAIKNNKFNYIYFLNSIDHINDFDCIFAMSVFCKHPESSNLQENTIYKFDSYNKEIINLDSKLKSGGIFINFNSNYYFSDTDIFNKYDPIIGDFEEEFVRKFNKNGFYFEKKSPVIYLKK